MKNVTVYMGPMCAFCDAAKRLLHREFEHPTLGLEIREFGYTSDLVLHRFVIL